MTDKIRILHIVRPAEGGIKEHLVSLATNCDPQKFIMRAACPKSSGIYERLQEAGIGVYPVDIVGELSPLKDWHSIKQISAVINEFRPDIVHTHSSKAGLVGRIAAKKAQVPVIIFTSHNSIFYPESLLFKKIIYAITEKILASFTDKIITVSQALKDEIIQWEKINPHKIEVIYNGIDIPRFQLPIDKNKICADLGLDPNQPIVGTIARLAPQKGVRFLIEAAAQFRHTGIQFLIIGDGPLREELEALAKRLSLEDSIKFAGFRSEVNRILPIMDLFVLPSLTEGQGMTILEAMAAARTIVASEVGGIPEAVINRQTGLLVPPGNVPALAAAIDECLHNSELAAAMAESGSRLVSEKFSLPVMIKKVTELYLALYYSKLNVN